MLNTFLAHMAYDYLLLFLWHPLTECLKAETYRCCSNNEVDLDTRKSKNGFACHSSVYSVILQTVVHLCFDGAGSAHLQPFCNYICRVIGEL